MALSGSWHKIPSMHTSCPVRLKSSFGCGENMGTSGFTPARLASEILRLYGRAGARLSGPLAQALPTWPSHYSQ